MKLTEVMEEFKNGAAIKRKDWDYGIVYVPQDSISLECVLADDWELLSQSENVRQVKKRMERYIEQSADLMHGLIRDIEIIIS